MSDEQDPTEFGPRTVKGGKPRLSKTGGHYDQTSLIAILAGPLQGVEGLPLDRTGMWPVAAGVRSPLR